MEVGIVGATGLVGRTLLSILESKGYDFHNYHLFASSDKCEQMPYFNREIPISNIILIKQKKWMFYLHVLVQNLLNRNFLN